MTALWRGIDRDVAHAFRTLRHDVSFTTIGVLTLALTIGITSSIFSLVNAIYFTLPVEHTERLANIRCVNQEQGIDRALVSVGDFLEYRGHVRSFQRLEAVRETHALWTSHGDPTLVQVVDTTAGLLGMWGTPPILGRGFADHDQDRGAVPVVLLTHGFWQRKFGGDRGVLGRIIRLDDRDATIIGILPKSLEVGDLSRFDIWRPLTIPTDSSSRDRRELWVSGMLADGATVEQADAEVRIVSQSLQRRYPQTNAGWTAVVRSFEDDMAEEGFWTVLSLLTLAAAFVLSIACANVAIMMLARGSARAHEIAVRSALGAQRWRIVRETLTESTMLAVGAGCVGILVTRAFLAGMAWVAGSNSNISAFMSTVVIDRNVLLFTSTLALFSPLLFSLVPALLSVRIDVGPILKGADGRGHGERRMTGQRVLMVVQMALALSLVGVTAVLVRSLIALETVSLEFDPEHVLTFRMELPENRYRTPDARLLLFASVKQRVTDMPGIAAAAWMSGRPHVEAPSMRPFVVAGRLTAEPERRPRAGVVVIEPGFSKLARVPLLRGRDLAESDDGRAGAVCLVNREAARRYWNSDGPLGETIRLDEPGDPALAIHQLRIVGIIEDVRAASRADRPAPLIYVPLRQHAQSDMAMMIWPSVKPSSVAVTLRTRIWDLDRNLPAPEIVTVAAILGMRLGGMRTIGATFMAFAVFALALASAGIYGTLSCLVARRTREIAIRVALGARPRTILASLARQVGYPVATGLALGLVGAGVLGRILEAGATHIIGYDLLLFALVTSVPILSALIASYIPVRRAMRVDPQIVLRTG